MRVYGVWKVCQQCGADYEAKDERPNRQSKYCSRACRDDARRTKVTLACVQCGNQFQRKAYLENWSTERGPFCGFACYGQWQSENMTGENSPTYRPHIHLDLVCDWCGVEFQRERSKHQRSSVGLAFCTRDCFQGYARKYWVGPGNPRWKGGTDLRRCYGYLPMRKKALKRDAAICQHCGSSDDLIVHHIVPLKDCTDLPNAHALDNLLTLCSACHKQLHSAMR